MITRDKVHMLSILGLMLAGNNTGDPRVGKVYPEPKPLTAEEKAEIADKVAFNRGLKKFWYGENFLYALNKKNADRKAEKNGWL